MAEILFRQLFERASSTYTYLMADGKNREAVIVDPVLETVDRDLKLISELELKVLYILETHLHADHITGAGKIADVTGAKIALSENAHAEGVDIPLRDGDELRFGMHRIQAISTPGHTDSCMCFLIGGRVLTGDALMIRGNGRTDFQQGSAKKLYHSVTTKLFTLPDETLVYPAHDYKGFTSSTIGEEKRHNVRLSQNHTLSEFIQIMNNLKLDPPKKIDIAVPSNLKCGRNS